MIRHHTLSSSKPVISVASWRSPTSEDQLAAQVAQADAQQHRHGVALADLEGGACIKRCHIRGVRSLMSTSGCYSAEVTQTCKVPQAAAGWACAAVTVLRGLAHRPQAAAAAWFQALHVHWMRCNASDSASCELNRENSRLDSSSGQAFQYSQQVAQAADARFWATQRSSLQATGWLDATGSSISQLQHTQPNHGVRRASDNLSRCHRREHKFISA